MKNRVIKLIVCIAIVSSLMVGFCTSFASAEPAIVTRVKAGVAAAMLAAQLVITPVDVLTSEPIASGIDPEGKLQWVETFPEYLERSKIRVYPDVVTIDGVPYTDIWLGPEAADTLRLKGLDFATAYNILNNQSSAISYASGVGYWDGVPVYSGISYPSVSSVNNGTQISTFETFGTFEFGDNSYIVVGQGPSSDYGYVEFFINNISYYRNPSSGYASLDWLLKGLAVANSGNDLYYLNPNGSSGSLRSLGASNYYVNEPFSFDYTSGVIDAPLDPEDGLLMRIPSSYTDPDPQVTEHNYNIHDLINIYPSVATPQGHEVEINPELNPDFQTDIDLGNGIGDLIRIILTLLDVLDNVDIEFSPEPDAPQPGPVDPDPAEPDTPLSDQEGTWLDNLLRWLKEAIDNLSNRLENQLQDIYHEIDEDFDAIREWWNGIPEVIKRAHAKGMKDALGSIKKIILPLLAPIKAFLGLWHYVVEWVAAIGTPFTWIFGIMSSTSYNLVLPIYASLAGFICIAIYKSFGR